MEGERVLGKGTEEKEVIMAVALNCLFVKDQEGLVDDLEGKFPAFYFFKK